MSVFLAVTPAEAASCRGYRVPLVHIAYAVGDGGRLLRAVLRTLLPLRAAVWAERGVCLLCGALLLACAGYLTLCWHAGPWPLLVCLLLGLRCCRNEEI